MSISMSYHDQAPGRISGRFRSHSTIHAPDGKPASLLFAMLPAIVQTRLPKLHSFRNSVSELRSRSARPSGKVSPLSSGTSTPLTSYSSRTGSVDAAINPFHAYDHETLRDDASTSSRPSSSGSSTLPVFPVSEVETGINWKYANQGSCLLNQAFQESCALDPATYEKTPIFTRNLYVHSVSYLLKGLPTELAQSETLALRESIPSAVVESIEMSAPRELIPYPSSNTGPIPTEPDTTPSLIHQAIAAMILQVFVLVQFLLPYIKVFIAAAYRYERQHHVSEWVLSTSIDTIDELGRRSIYIADKVCAMNDGKVGQAINDLTIWWVKGVTGGIHQGFREGVVVLREDGRREGDVANGGKYGDKFE